MANRHPKKNGLKKKSSKNRYTILTWTVTGYRYIHIEEIEAKSEAEAIKIYNKNNPYTPIKSDDPHWQCIKTDDGTDISIKGKTIYHLVTFNELGGSCYSHTYDGK